MTNKVFVYSIFNFIDFCHKVWKFLWHTVTKLSRSRSSKKLKLF